MLFGYSLLLLVRWPCCVRDKTFLFSKRSVFCIFLFFFFKNKIRARREQGLGAVLGRNSHFDTTRRQSQKSEEVCVSHKGPTLDALWHSASELKSGTHRDLRRVASKVMTPRRNAFHTHTTFRERGNFKDAGGDSTAQLCITSCGAGSFQRQCRSTRSRSLSSGPINKGRRSFFFLFFLVALTCQGTSTLFYVVNCALRLCTSSCLSHRFVLSSQIQGRRVFRSEHCKSRVGTISVDIMFGSRRLGARGSPFRILGVLFGRCERQSHTPLILCRPSTACFFVSLADLISRMAAPTSLLLKVMLIAIITNWLAAWSRHRGKAMIKGVTRCKLQSVRAGSACSWSTYGKPDPKRDARPCSWKKRS